MQVWKRYINNTISLINVGSVNHILSVLNSFNMNIKSTNELENGGKLEFEDVFLCRKKKRFIQ